MTVGVSVGVTVGVYVGVGVGASPQAKVVPNPPVTPRTATIAPRKSASMPATKGKNGRRRKAKADSDFRGAEAVEKMLAGVECRYSLDVDDRGNIVLEIERCKVK